MWQRRYGVRSMRQLVTMSAPRSRERTHAGTQFVIVFLFSLGFQPVEQCCSRLGFGVALLPPVNTSRDSLVDMPRVVTDTVKVTTLIVTPGLASETP